MSFLTRFIPTLNLDISKLILLAALGFTLLYNQAFFRNSFAVYGDTAGGLAFLASLALFLFAATLLVLGLLCFRYTAKPVLVVVILCAAGANFYMTHYNIVLDTTMLANVFATDAREVKDLISPALVVQLLLLGLLPAMLVIKANIKGLGFLVEARQRLKLLGTAFALLIISILPFTSYYTSFFREHKILRYYANPATLVYSSGKFMQESMASPLDHNRASIGMDAKLPVWDNDRELIVLVVGEAARADHFSLNGYRQETNPLLARENVISFENVISCGTATAYSLPCMFALQGREAFDLDESRSEENLLDVLDHAGVNVLWRDNNSDSKGVATAIEFEDFQSPDTNPVCDIECRDIGMLSGLDQYIATHPVGDIAIVLHQMGTHGPAYYKRYPENFEVFTPVCATAELGSCTDTEINNAYDNAIRYTDYFLSEVIHFLQQYDKSYETAMYYMSDHGESLGENGLYLHGLPWMLAPMNQKNVASVMWFGKGYHVDDKAVRAFTDDALSHDNYFHTVLGLMEIQTSIYDPALDLVVHEVDESPATPVVARVQGRP